MRKWLITGALLAAGCQQQEAEPEQRAEDLRTFDVQQQPSYPTGTPAPPPAPPAPPPPPTVAPPPLVRSESGAVATADMAGGPNINVSAAPGVAFNYRYAYRLANARIQPVQEAHAAMCEKLGITRCRVTGMRYSLVGERDISASLEMKVDPAIARQFGKAGTKVVTDADGMLVDQQISGVDVGSAIEGANRGQAQLQDELDRVNRELSRSGLSNVIRDRLLSEAQSLRSEIRALGEQRRAGEESLATTPVVFFYGSGRIVPGFEEPTPLSDALNRAGYNFRAALGSLIVVSATLLPWLLLAFLLYLAARRLGLLRLARGGGSYRSDPPSTELRDGNA